MKSIQTQINLMKDALEFKRRVLAELLKLSEQQGNAIGNEVDYLEQFDALALQKAARLGKVTALDDGFAATYERLRGTILTQKELYRDDLKALQALILAIGDLDVALRVVEERNATQLALRLKLPQAKSGPLGHYSSQAIKNYSKQKKL